MHEPRAAASGAAPAGTARPKASAAAHMIANLFMIAISSRSPRDDHCTIAAFARVAHNQI
jgi:hypothetical protein